MYIHQWLNIHVLYIYILKNIHKLIGVTSYYKLPSTYIIYNNNSHTTGKKYPLMHINKYQYIDSIHGIRDINNILSMFLTVFKKYNCTLRVDRIILLAFYNTDRRLICSDQRASMLRALRRLVYKHRWISSVYIHLTPGLAGCDRIWLLTDVTKNPQARLN